MRSRPRAATARRKSRPASTTTTSDHLTADVVGRIDALGQKRRPSLDMTWVCSSLELCRCIPIDLPGVTGGRACGMAAGRRLSLLETMKKTVAENSSDILALSGTGHR